MQEKDVYTGSRDYLFNTDWFRTTEVAPGITAIREPFHSEDVISYLIKGSKQSFLIDSGMGLADISTVLLKSGISVLLTHTHWDHMGGASSFNDIYVFNHDFEIDRLSRGWNGSEIVGYNREEFAPGHQPPEKYDHLMFNISGKESFSKMADGDRFDLGDDIIEVIHTPGHTPGSVCFYSLSRQALFTGDTLYPGPEYLHLSESDFSEYQNSLKKLHYNYWGKLKTIYPGHNANMANPRLLSDHLIAASGAMAPISTEKGSDAFGPYIHNKFPGFSLMLKEP
jgi:glyoxylase-like metal-dependent hydrolase (beta-lactamase superfamily II)